MVCKPEHKKPEPIKARVVTVRGFPNRNQRRHPSPDLQRAYEKGELTGEEKNRPVTRTHHPLNKKQREKLLSGV